MSPLTLEEVARTSNDEAIRARFDASTLTALRLIALFFAVVSLPHLIEAGTQFRTLLGSLVLIAALTVLAGTAKKENPLTRLIQRRVRATAIAFVIFETAVIIIHNGSADSEAVVPFAIICPLVAIFLRLLPGEHVLLHVTLAAISWTTFLIMPSMQGSLAATLVPPLMVNGSALGAALFLSRRSRRAVIAEWDERRAGARERMRLLDELRYARELQVSMLPAGEPSLSWAEIAGASIPAAEVGGDYYDYFPAEGRIAIVCGDVAGHGLASGLVLAALRGGLILLRDTLDNPSDVLRRLHDLVAHTTRRRMLVTMSFALVQPRKVVIASAGHPPVIVRGSDGSVTTVDLYAPPLGVRLPATFTQRELPLAPGDVLVLHSDGIYETRNDADEIYGLERLQRIVSESGGRSAADLRDAVVEDLTRFRGIREQDDDVTIVVVRISA